MKVDAAIGQRLPRLEVREKVTGKAQYLDEITRPGMLHGAVLGSPHAHARIVSRDVSKALALPGVMAVLTGDDLQARYGPIYKDETVLAVDKVRYAGEPVAAVAARDRATARRALALIDIVYEELPPVMDAVAAVQEDAPVVHEELESYFKVFPALCGGNVMSHQIIVEGDVESAWDECDAIVENVYETQAQCHLYIEPVGAVAEFAEDGKLTVWSSNQSINRVQANVAESLRMSMAKVRAVTPRVGGGFGGKMEATVQPIAAALARATRRPVKVVLSRHDDFRMMRSRHATRIRVKTGARKDGTLVAREAELLFDGGAYADDSIAVLGFAMLMARGPYRIEHLKVDGKVVYTNKLRAAGFRGFGNPQVTYAGESQIDELARKLGLDPLEMRIRNAVRSGDKAVGGQTLQGCGLVECLEKVRDQSRWAERRGPSQAAGEARGIGVSAFSHVCGVLSTGAVVRLLEDGSITMSTGAVDIGQGSDTVLAQICAGTLGLSTDQVNVTPPDTDTSPYNWGTAASRVTYMVGRAVNAAANSVKEQIFRHASEMLETPPENLVLLPGGAVGVSGGSNASVSFFEVSLRATWGLGGPIIGNHSFVFDGEGFDPKRTSMQGFPFANLGSYIFGAQAVEVAVDTDTGKVEVKEAWSAHDVGRAINPMAVEGQIHGGFVQGVGYALYEEMVWDGESLANPSMSDYKVPGALDVPYAIHPIIVEDPEPSGPFGAKGIGEPGIIGVAPAIANAIDDATGVRLRSLPMTPEKVFRALNEAG